MFQAWSIGMSNCRLPCSHTRTHVCVRCCGCGTTGLVLARILAWDITAGVGSIVLTEQ